MSFAESLANAFLTLPAEGYRAVQKVREKAYSMGLFQSRRAPVPVISVGNLIMGGSGKTPLVICLAEMLLEMGMRPAVVSRGYRGTNREPYLVVGEGTRSGPTVGPSVVGDEPYLIAQRLPDIPVVIGRIRIHPVFAACQLFSIDAVILDDGFQHMALGRDLDIVLINGFEDRMFPLGRLREPLSALRRADMVVLVGLGVSIPGPAQRYTQGLPVFSCCQNPVGLVSDPSSPLVSLSVLEGRPVLLASAIANPERFRDTARELGWKILDHRIFPDHHVITDSELRSILTQWEEATVVVTEKDWVKLPQWFKNTGRVRALRIELVFPDKEAFRRTILGLITDRSC